MRALLNAGNDIFDVTGLVQIVTAKNGNEQYSGNGIVIFRANHINGNASIFLDYVGEKLIFGEFVSVYALNEKWLASDYSKYEMIANYDNALVDSIDSILRDKWII